MFFAASNVKWIAHISHKEQNQANERKIAMTKTELVTNISIATNLSRRDSAFAVEAITAAITDALKSDEKVTLLGFGTFSLGYRASREGRNPQTGATIRIEASKQPKFKPSTLMKDSVNNES